VKRALAWLACAAGLCVATPARVDAQLLVAPRRPGQTNVRYAEFDWRYVDVLTQEKLELDVEWEHGPRFHLSPYKPPAMGTAFAWPALRDAPTGPVVVPGSDPRDVQTIAADEKSEPECTRSARVAKKKGLPMCPAEQILETAGGVRLFFYESERTLAERAAASIEKSYRYLAEQFGYAPRKTFAYFLYGNYIDFMQTELFPIQEGVLGVTSTISLEVALPYFGDHRMFEDVSTHELAHEFTLQKLMTVARADGESAAPLGQMPLWFIEGLAEYYAKRGLDPEAEVLVRDMIVNPTDEGYALGSFFDERLESGLWTYKVGQARCAFLEEIYGAGTLQRILEESPRLMRSAERGGVSSFRKLVAKVTGEASSRVAARFERWIKRRAFRSYLKTSQDRTDMGVIFEVDDIVQTMSAAPSGNLLMYRSIDRDTGDTKLYLADRHEPGQTERVAIDAEPGVESLHPVAGRNFDLNDDLLTFVAQDAGADVIYVQRVEHTSDPQPCGEKGERAAMVCSWDVDIELGEREALRVRDLGITAVEAVALSPDGRRIAFVGLDESGQKDVWITGDLRGDAGKMTRITRDVYGERDVAWGPRGVVYNSDATGHGKYNLFFAAVSGERVAAPVRLTHEARDELDPEMLPDGRIVFVAYDAAGANIYEHTERGIVRHTDVSTALYDPSPGPDGSVWALHHQSQRRLPVRLTGTALRAEPTPQSAPDGPAVPLPRLSLLVDREYDPLAIENWRPGALFVLAGFSGESVFGSLVATASDRLQDHGVMLTTSVFGSFDRTDADLTYINQENRVVWGAGIFHDVSAQLDDTFALDESLLFVSYQRFFGVTGIARYPFDRFFFAQAGLGVGWAEYFVSDETADALGDPEQNDAGRDLLTPWEQRNEGLRFRTETTFSLGYSTIGLHRATGPIRGSALILSHTVGNEPFDDLAYHQTRLDAEHYFRIYGATNLLVRGAAGTTGGDQRAPQFFLSSFHTLRGVPFGDTRFLLGRDFFYSTVELQFPIATLVEFPLVDLEGVLAADFGGVGDGMNDLWDRRVLDLVFGVNLGFAPIVVRLHFAQPIGLGVETPNNGNLTFNFSLAWRY
jgi:hypothetical protein